MIKPAIKYSSIITPVAPPNNMPNTKPRIVRKNIGIIILIESRTFEPLQGY